MKKKCSNGATDLVHELQAPLSVLKARLETGLRASWCGHKSKALLQECLEEVNGINQLVVDILLLEKADSGQLAQRRSRCSLAMLLGTVVQLFEPVASARGVALTASVDGPIDVDANEGQLKRVLSNLVDNAVKYTPRGGQVSIEASARGALAEIRVQDTGCGISAEALEHIFERFYRAEESRRNGIAGVGLGLSIAQTLAKVNGATIEVESAVGKGSCLVLKLPALREPPP